LFCDRVYAMKAVKTPSVASSSVAGKLPRTFEA